MKEKKYHFCLSLQSPEKNSSFRKRRVPEIHSLSDCSGAVADNTIRRPFYREESIRESLIGVVSASR